MHYGTRVDCDFEAPVKGSGIQKRDHVNWHRDRVVRCNLAQCAFT